MNNRARLQTIRDSAIAFIRDILEEHESDTMDVTDLGSTPVTWPDNDPEETFTLDRIYFDRGQTLIDSSSAFSSRTDRIEELSTDVVVDILDFLEDNEETIWMKNDEDTDAETRNIERIDGIRIAEEFVKDTYLNEDVCMGDLLFGMKVSELPNHRDLTIEQVFSLYVIAKHGADGDGFFRYNDSCGETGERIDLVSAANGNDGHRTVYVCELCGSEHIMTKSWRDVNTGIVNTNMDSEDTDDNWCEACQQHGKFIPKEEFEEMMDTWAREKGLAWTENTSYEQKRDTYNKLKQS